VTIHPLPVADYSTSGPICATGEITFTDKSVAKSTSLTSWEWNFGDPTSGTRNTSTSQSPVHAYLAAGTYPVTLVVTNSNGCKSVNPIPAIVVKHKPTADFILPEVCLKDTYAQFTDASKVDAPASIDIYNWNFGDINANIPPVTSNTSTLKDPKHSYKKVVQAYDVTLEVITKDGCRDTIMQVLQINGEIPASKFEVLLPSNLCANDFVSIKNLSTVNVGSVTKIEIIWDAVNNPTVVETDEDPKMDKIYKHQYPNFQNPLTKTYQVTVKAYSGESCMNPSTQTITINAAPKVAFQPLSNICFDATPIQITQATETGNVPGTFKFFGNGVSSSGLFSPAVAGSGVHTLKYVYTSNTGGCADSITQTIKVWERAVANFNLTSTPICEKQPMNFSDLSTSTEGSITQRIWDFGYPSSGVTRTVPNAFTHTLPGYGQYKISLTVKTSDGCTSETVTKTIEALPIARPTFTFPPVSCLPNANIQFTNTSSVPNAAASTLTYLWDFGDPASGAVNSSPQKDPQHTYANLGPFDIKLQVTTDAGCIHDTTIVLNTIHPQPIASFTADLADVCLGGAVQLTNTSDPKDGTLKSLYWDLDDGSTNNQTSFSHTYRNTGSYNISLYIINSYDCKSTIETRTVSINPIPVADAGPYRVVLEGGNITINANATNANGLKYLWTPPAGLNDPTLLRPIASPANDTRYLLTVTSDKGCVDTSSMFLKVLFKPIIPNTFTPNGDGINDRWDILYLDSYPGAIVEVYNSIGTLMFRSVGYNVPWDGTVKGRKLPLGTYYYVVDPKNGRAKISGYVTIL
jgi:gliding motility-associated-like protein